MNVQARSKYLTLDKIQVTFETNSSFKLCYKYDEFIQAYLHYNGV